MTATLAGRTCRVCARPISPQRRPARPAGVALSNARELCTTCYGHARRDGTLHLYASVFRRHVDVAEDFAELVATRAVRTRECAAERLGMRLTALDRALYRAGVDVTVVPKRRRS